MRGLWSPKDYEKFCSDLRAAQPPPSTNEAAKVSCSPVHDASPGSTVPEQGQACKCAKGNNKVQPDGAAEGTSQHSTIAAEVRRNQEKRRRAGLSAGEISDEPYVKKVRSPSCEEKLLLEGQDEGPGHIDSCHAKLSPGPVVQPQGIGKNPSQSPVSKGQDEDPGHSSCHAELGPAVQHKGQHEGPLPLGPSEDSPGLADRCQAELGPELQHVGQHEGPLRPIEDSPGLADRCQAELGPELQAVALQNKGDVSQQGGQVELSADPGETPKSRGKDVKPSSGAGASCQAEPGGASGGERKDLQPHSYNPSWEGYKGGLDRVAKSAQRQGHTFMATQDHRYFSDISKNWELTKRFASFPTKAFFIEWYRIRHERDPSGATVNFYETLLPASLSRPYFDLDYKLPTTDMDPKWPQRLGAFCELLGLFLQTVFNLGEYQLDVRVSSAHGIDQSSQQFKHSSHIVLGGLYLQDVSARVLFSECFSLFIDNPPNETPQRLLDSTKYVKPKDLTLKSIWDTSVYKSNQNFRLLYSSKEGEARPLLPDPGQPSSVLEHMAFLEPGEVADLQLLSVESMKAFIDQKAVAAGRGSRGAARRPAVPVCLPDEEGPFTLSEEEKALVTELYQGQGHKGAQVAEVKHVMLRSGEPALIIKFSANEYPCQIAKRVHARALTGQSPYIRRMDTPLGHRYFYCCYDEECKGSGRLLERHFEDGISEWVEDYVCDGMKPYPLPLDIPGCALKKVTYMIQAPMGVGKSKASNDFLSKMGPETSILRITYSQSLSRKLSTVDDSTLKLEFVNYMDLTGPLVDVHRGVVCVDSLKRFEGREKGYDVVELDEINALLGHMAFESMEDKELTFDLLEWFISEAKVLICADAHLSQPRVLEYIKQLRADTHFYPIRNSFKRETNRQVELVYAPKPKEGKWFQEILEDLAEGKRSVVASMSKEAAEDLKVAAVARFGEVKKIKVYTSDTRTETQKAIADPVSAWSNLDLLVYSPCIGPGISYELLTFDRLYAYFRNSLSRSPDVFFGLQMLWRVRQLKEGTMKLFLERPTDAESILGRLPVTQEEVFQLYEERDSELYRVLDKPKGLRRLVKKGRAVYDRESASARLFANNILARVNSFRSFEALLLHEFQVMGIPCTVDLQSTQGAQPAPSCAAPRRKAPAEESSSWKPPEEDYVNYLIAETVLRALSPEEQRIVRVFRVATEVYGVEYLRIDKDFEKTWVKGQTVSRFFNLVRFCHTDFASALEVMAADLSKADEGGNTYQFELVLGRAELKVAPALIILQDILRRAGNDEGLDQLRRLEEVRVEVEQFYEVFESLQQQGKIEFLKNYFAIRSSSKPSVKNMKPFEQRTGYSAEKARNFLKRIISWLGLQVDFKDRSRAAGSSGYIAQIGPTEWIQDLQEKYGGDVKKQLLRFIGLPGLELRECSIKLEQAQPRREDLKAVNATLS